MKRKFSITLMAALALTLLLSGVGQALVLEGDNLKVGINDPGGMVDLSVPQGITFKPGPLPNDYTYPGTPWELYAISVGGTFVVGGVNGGNSNPGTLTTIDLSGGTTLQATTTGPAFNVGAASIVYTQTISFDKTFKHIHVSADILNNSLVDISDVYYTRGLDPDQDVLSGGGFATINTISGGSVTAVGPTTGLFITINNLTPDIAGVPSISGGWDPNPVVNYNGGAGGLVDGAGAGNPNDYAIYMTWFIGDLPHGVSKEIDLEYDFGVVPVPPSLVLLGSGLLGLVGLRRKLSA